MAHAHGHPEPDQVRPEGQYHDGYQDGLVPLRPLDLVACRTTDELVRGMAHTAFGGRKVGEAADLFEAMARDAGCGVVLTISGAMTIAKMGLLITELIDRELVQAIVSTGALVAHGLVEGAGLTHFKADPRRSDEQNFHDGYNRVYDTLELERNLDDAESILRAVLQDVPGDHVLCSSELHHRIGAWLIEHRPQARGILQSAYRKDVPVFAPAFSDCELGLDLALFNRDRAAEGLPTFRYDPFIDLETYVARMCAYERVGIFTIGGGVPRNWAQELGPYVELLVHRERIVTPKTRKFTYALRICPEPVHWGGLSGCTYIEGVSWGKFVPPSQGGRQCEVPADATIAWPLVVKAVLERLDREPPPNKHPIVKLPRGVRWTGREGEGAPGA